MRRIRDLDLGPYNSYRIQAVAAEAWLPECEADLLQAFRETAGRRVHLLGDGNNVILSRPRYEEPFLIVAATYQAIHREGTLVEGEAGASLRRLCDYSVAEGLAGLETYYDIPGTLGGAVVMNAGAGGTEMVDLVERVRFFSRRDLELRELSGSEAGFSYRDSRFQRDSDLVVTRAWLRLRHGDPARILAEMLRIRDQRWAKQPRDLPNAGSVFKRPQGRFVGPMIEELGLKGHRVGGAMVSPKHAGFIVNAGGATGTDILGLVAEIQRRVRDAYGVELELEQRVL